MDRSKVSELRGFISTVEADPALIHIPELSFFKSFLIAWGANIPPAPSSTEPTNDEETKQQPAPAEAPQPTVAEPSESEEEEPEPYPERPILELDPIEIGPESDEFPPAPCMEEKEFTDAEYDKVGELKEAAMEAIENDDFKPALEKYSEVMQMGNATAMLLTRRADILLKLKRPMAAIKDCDLALTLNPDNGKAYKTRGKAYRMTGKLSNAHSDLQQGQRIDYDEDTYEVQKIVDERWHKIEEYERICKRIDDEKEKKAKLKDIKKRKKSAQARYEQQKREEEEAKKNNTSGGMGGMPDGFGGMPGGMGGMPGGMGGMPGGMGGMPGGFGGMPGGMGGMGGGDGPDGMPGGMGNMFSGLMSDPEVAKIFQDPKTMAAMQDIMANPGNLSKYKDDPATMAAFQKLMSKFGGAGAAGGM